MIVDKMKNIASYAGILPYAEEFAALWQANRMDDSSCKVLHKDYATKDDDKRRFEVHAHTIDLMVGLEGSERIHITDESKLTPAEFLPDGMDGRKLDGPVQGSSILLEKGFFVAIYPGEAHMVGGHPDGVSVPLSKLVIKVPC